MSRDELITPPAIGGPRDSSLVPADLRPVQGPGYDDFYYPSQDPEDDGLDIRRYLFAILRYKWLLALALVIGGAGAYYAWTTQDVTYEAVGNIWIEAAGNRQGDGDVAPIRSGGLLERNAWIQLLRSYQVLDTVARSERLYIQSPEEFAPAFESFSLSERFAPGRYVLRVGEAGQDFTLVTAQGQLVQQANFGVPIGENVGFEWTPSRGSFPPGAVVDFTVLSARDAARRLSDRLQAGIDQQGNFIRLALTGQNPDRIASTLNAVMERHVSFAADLKRRRLDETLVILEEQLEVMRVELERAEQELEEFRVTTITLPSDQSTPIAPGLQITRDPVFANYFDMKVQIEQVRTDRIRLQNALRSFDTGDVRIEALELIPAAASSSELRRILDELLTARSQLRVLRDRYEDDYPPIQDLLTQVRSIEETAVPRVVQGLIDELMTREAELQQLVDETATDLQEIPPRTIEEGRLERRVQTTENLYNVIRGRVETARLAAASSIPDVRILDYAEPPQVPSQDRRLPTASLIFFGCLGLAMGAAVVLDHFDARFRYAEDIGREIGLDILGSVPRIATGKGRRGVLNAAQALEAFRELRIHVGFAYGSAGPITLAITSPSSGEGKSLIASNLAVAFAEVGKRTILVDGDTRRGDAHRLLGRERSPGLIDYLRERSEDDIIQATDHANLDFVGSGSRGVSTPELLGSPRMAHFFGSLKRSYDVIIVDTPPLASGGDPLILGSLAGNLAVVIRTGSTEKGLAHAKLDQLARLPIRILGAILNDVSAANGYHSYYGTYLPGYEPQPEEGDMEHTPLLTEVEAADTE